MTIDDLGSIAFNAYRVQVGGITYDGKPIPEFGELTSLVQSGWQAAARAVVAARGSLPPQPAVLGISVDEQIMAGERIGD